MSLYDDTQELLCAADVLITDYSSLQWDFSLQLRPVFVYAEDIEDYRKERGFTVPPEEWPFSVASDNNELAANIMGFDEREYADKVARFHQKMGNYDVGNCCHNLNQHILDHGGIAQ